MRYLIFPLLAAPLFIRYLPKIPVTAISASLLVTCCAAWLGFTWNNNLFDFFDRYNINTVIMPGMSESSGNIYPLIEALAVSSYWHLVFADDSALVFVRDIPANKALINRNSLNKRTVQVHLVRLADRLIGEDPVREEYWQTKANALQLLGDRQAALDAYRKTLQLNPNNVWAQRMLTAGGR